MNAPLTNPVLPRLVGICGNPKSGKSEVQKILAEEIGYEPVDDGQVLRRFCIDYLGMTEDDVYTQEGKARYTEILGKNWQNRDILGTLGKQFESMFGEQILPFIATRNLHPAKLYSFGSVRKIQGAFYRSLGGIVIEVRNPDAKPSGYDFDWYDPALVDVSIDNDALARGLPVEEARADLKVKVLGAINQTLMAA